MINYNIDYEDQAIKTVSRIAYPFWKTAIETELNDEPDSYKSAAWSAAYFALRGAKDALYCVSYWQTANQNLYLSLVDNLDTLIDTARVHLYGDF